MPYKKQYQRRRYARKKRSPYGGYLDTATKALTVAYAVKRLVNVEYKHKNTLVKGIAVTDAGLITNVSFLSEGDNAISRDGGQVKFTSFRLSYSLAINPSATTTLVRCLIVQDKQTNQAQFTLADLFFDATIVDVLFFPYNVNNASRFNVLYDKLHALTINGSNRLITNTIHRKLNMKTRYDADDGTIADLTQDSLTVLFISDQVTNDPTVNFNWRSRFIDN